MITIKLNGKNIQIAAMVSLLEFINNQQIRRDCSAFAVNGSFIPRANYAGIMLQNGDEIDVINPMQGG